MSLIHLGWSPALQESLDALGDSTLVAARVVRQEKTALQLDHVAGHVAARVPGRIRALPPIDRPAVGDWVAARPGDPWSVEAVLPRRTVFTRKRAGERTYGEQVVAANVDVVLLVAGLDGDASVRRLERYLALARESGADPVVVLNKVDVARDLAADLAAARAVAGAAPVLAVSAATGEGLHAVRALLAPGRTVALLGSSGVGKSSLVNALLGEARQATGRLRAKDGRGTHTTTRREIIATPGGALLLDTPGMRELGLWSGEEGVRATFDDVVSLALRCKFTDRGHETEPGCAIRAALDSGDLAPDRWESWLRLQRELAFAARKSDPAARRAQAKQMKRFSKGVRERTHDIKAGRKHRAYED